MDNKNSTILTDKQEMQLRKPIDDYIGKIQSKLTISGQKGQTGLSFFKIILAQQKRRSYSFKRRKR